MVYAFFAYLIFINIVAFFMYGIDKKRAINHKSRIPESVLLWMARLGGGLGSWLAMRFYHHKKKHTKFMIQVPLWITVWMVIAVLVLAFGDGNLSEEMSIIKNRF